MSSYHNTTQQQDTGVFEAKAQTQEEYVLKLFKHCPNGLTADEVVEHLIEVKNLASMNFYDALSRGISIDKSVRRAISNLVTADQLGKTTISRVGRSGRLNLVYVVIDQENKLKKSI
jgi:hypothetical protein